MKKIAVGPRPHRIDPLADLNKFRNASRFPHRVVIQNDLVLFHEDIELGMEAWLDQQGCRYPDHYLRGMPVYEGSEVRIAFAFKDVKLATLFKLTWG